MKNLLCRGLQVMKGHKFNQKFEMVWYLKYLHAVSLLVKQFKERK